MNYFRKQSCVQKERNIGKQNIRNKPDFPDLEVLERTTKEILGTYKLT